MAARSKPTPQSNADPVPDYEWRYIGNGEKAHALFRNAREMVALCRIGGPDSRMADAMPEKCKRCERILKAKGIH